MYRGLVAAIPARYASSRLPGKPLLEIAGRPMIEHVVRRAEAAGVFERVVVLTDDDRIADAVEGFDGDVERTPANCATGTDRIAWAARGWPEARVIVNVQGDEPLVDPEALRRLALSLDPAPEPASDRATPESGADPTVFGMATLAAPLDRSDPRFGNPNTVKVARGADERALYFSRAPIPHDRDGGSSAPALQHVGVYAYRRDVLLRLAALEPTPLEQLESLEQLRALEHGIAIRVLRLERAAAPGVDTLHDLDRVRALFAASPDPR